MSSPRCSPRACRRSVAASAGRAAARAGRPPRRACGGRGRGRDRDGRDRLASGVHGRSRHEWRRRARHGRRACRCIRRSGCDRAQLRVACWSALDGSRLCAVVKADGYGHGAVERALAALRAGATWLAVATLGEVEGLRDRGIEAPILIMGALRDRAELERAIELHADLTLWRERSVALAAEAAAQVSGEARVHVKLDTGMGRLGTRDPAEASRVITAALAAPGVRLTGVMTHFATADDARRRRLLRAPARRVHRLGGRGQVRAPRDRSCTPPTAPPSLREPRAHFDMVRCGIAIYGLDPFGEDPVARDLEPALELSSYVAEVKRCAARREHRLRAALHRRARRHLHRRAADRLRRRLAARAVRTTPTSLIAGRRLPAGGHRQHGQRRRRPRSRPRARTSCAAREAVLIGIQGSRADHRRGGGPAPGHDQLRDRLRAVTARGAPRVPPATANP